MNSDKPFDLIVVGAGMAAVAGANKCARAGWSVAVVDELPYGGTCMLRGCDPKKMLRRGAEIVDSVRLMEGKGIVAPELAIDWSELMAFKRTFTDKAPGRIEGSLTKNGVVALHGTARFVDRNTIEIDGKKFQARYFLIATGAMPRPLDVPGAEYLIASDQFLELEALPARILFVGGGFVSFEFAHIAARAGSEVQIVDQRTRALKRFDPQLVGMLVEKTRSVGIGVQSQAECVAVEKTDQGLVVTCDCPDGERRWTVDLVVHGAGRVPALDRLDLAAAGIDAGADGVRVSKHLQSVSNPAVYAAGDAADLSPGLKVTPVAVFEGKVAASNMLKGNQATPDYRGVPTAVFTVPELVRVGLLEDEAREKGIDVEVKFTDTGGWFSNMRVGETTAAVKFLIDRSSDQIVGAHMLGPEYAELVNIIGLGMRLGLTTKDLKMLVSAYPTVGSDLGSMI